MRNSIKSIVILALVAGITTGNLLGATVVAFNGEDGKVTVDGKDYVANSKGPIKVTASKDGSESAITALEDVTLMVKDENGKPQEKKLKKGSVVKIWKKLDKDGKNVKFTVLITGPDGALIEAITYTVPSEQKSPKVAVVPPKKGEPKKEGQGMQKTDDLLVAPPLVGLSSARGDEAIMKANAAAKAALAAKLLPKPKKKPSPTPVGKN